MTPSLPFIAVSDIDEVNRIAANELTRITNWLVANSAQQIVRAEDRIAEKTMSDKVKLITGHPASKPFWVDFNKSLQCFACDFTQMYTPNFEECAKFHWMTKRIIKNQ